MFFIKGFTTEVAKNFIKARAIERSTYEGIIGAASIIGAWIKPEYRELILTGGGSIWSLIRIITKDATGTLGKSLQAAVQAHDDLLDGKNDTH